MTPSAPNANSSLERAESWDPPIAPEPRVATFQFGKTRFVVLSVPLANESAASDLSPSEREVAALARLSNAAIARRRGTAERTVANQMASILRKLRVSSRYGLVALLALSTHVNADP